MEKYKVSNIEVSGHKFSVGDTINLTNGSLPNGDFLCAMISSESFARALMQPPHLSAIYVNYKFIISKIYNESDGLNSEIVLVTDIDKNTAIWINPVIAISKNEIVLK